MSETIIDDSRLPSVENASLPATYQRAQTALAECSRVDECQQWADKAEALASYAKQSKDESLRKMADRIQARAIRRAGELLRQIEPAHGANQNIGEGAHPNVLTRTQAATEAGMSDHQRKQAQRVANIPEDQFEEQVESESPPTVTRLAEQGKKNLVDLDDINPNLYAKATKVRGAISRMAEMCSTNDPREVAKGFKPHEVEEMKRNVETIDKWLDLFVTNLE